MTERNFSTPDYQNSSIEQNQSGVLLLEHESPDPNVPPPTQDPTMFYGIVGEVARAAANGTEVHPVAAAAIFLSYLSANVGRDVYYMIGNTPHHARLFTAHIGRSGRGRKTDAVSMTTRIRKRINEAWSNTPGQYHGGGLSSREGIAVFVHDGYEQGKNTIPAIDDKRLWIVENEFSNVLHQGRREGNTLSAALRDAWDGHSIQPATKTARIWATDPHIALHVSVTPDELRELLTSRDISNGFANRFLMLFAERTCLKAHPETTPAEVVNEFANRTADIINFARGGYPEKKDTRPMSLSDSARRIYTTIYEQWHSVNEVTPRLASLMERSAPYVIRLAMLFALTDKTLTIDEAHIKAAIAWVDYSRQTVRYIFTEGNEIVAAENATDKAEKLRAYLKDKGDWSNRSEINQKCFMAKASQSDIDIAIKTLLSETPPAIEQQTRPRADGRPGRKMTLYRLNQQS